MAFGDFTNALNDTNEIELKGGRPPAGGPLPRPPPTQR
jgi:hypothetical protein